MNVFSIFYESRLLENSHNCHRFTLTVFCCKTNIKSDIFYKKVSSLFLAPYILFLKSNLKTLQINSFLCVNQFKKGLYKDV